MRIDVRKLEGRDHYVVPTVMIVAGTWTGSNGPLYYPAAALNASAVHWNGRPVVVYHPDMMVSGGAAGNPEVFNRQKVGTVFNTRFDGQRLKAEAWIDVERVAQVDQRVQTAILARQVMEVSTGLYTTCNGNEVRTIAPDHLAILPDQRGACSVAHGAGLVRNGTVEDAALFVWQPTPVQPVVYPPYTPPQFEAGLPLPAWR